MIPNLEAAVINQTLEVKPDADGEERKLQADVVLELDMKLYQEEDHEVIMDVYTPFRQCMPKGRKEILESLLVRNFSRCRIADRIEVKETQGKILQICHSQGKIKIDKIQIVKEDVYKRQMLGSWIVVWGSVSCVGTDRSVSYTHLYGKI